MVSAVLGTQGGPGLALPTARPGRLSGLNGPVPALATAGRAGLSVGDRDRLLL